MKSLAMPIQQGGDGMSGKSIISNSYLEDIGDAIRYKKDTEDTYYPSQMGDAIRSIEGSSITVDETLSDVSENPVQNKVITIALQSKCDTSYVDNQLSTKASTAVATQSANGLISCADKIKLDNVGSVVTVSGTTPTITALSGVRYVCGEVATLDITPCVSGICDIVFTSGSTATVLTLPSTVKFPDGAFTPEANTTYELNIMDGIYGVVMAWT